jgi:hypothetical protein
MRSVRAPIEVALLFVALTVAFQPGLSRHVADAFPMSRYAHLWLAPEDDVPRDTLVHMGILAHGVHALTHDPARFFQWPVFHPHRSTLAYADHQLAQAVLSLPLWLFTDSVPLVHNLLLLASFVGCGAGAWLLVRYLTGSSAASVVAGILFAFWPQRAHDLDEIHILWCFWIPPALYSLHRWAETGRWRHAMGFALLTIAQCLSGLYLGLYFLTLVLPLGAWLLFRSGRLGQWRTWAQVAAGAALGALLLIPPALPYLAVREQMGFSRTVGEAEFFSLGLSLYLKPYPGTWLHRLLDDRLSPAGTGQFLGLVPLALVVLGTATFLSRSAPTPAASRRNGILYVVWTVAAILLSGGPTLRLWGSLEGPSIAGPFGILFRYLPPFQGTRIPARFGYLAVLGMAVLAGFGVAWLLRRVRQPRLRTAAAAGVCAACFLEMRAEPPDLYRDRIPHGVPAATRWLGHAGGSGAVVEFPANPLYEDAVYSYLAGYHHRPIVNGYSAYVPQATYFLEERMKRFPAPAARRLLKEVGVRYVVHHDPSWKPPPELASALPAPVFTDGSTRIFEVSDAPPPEAIPPAREPLRLTGLAAESDVAGSHPGLAVDGDEGTAWEAVSSSSSTRSAYLRVDLGTEIEIGGVRIRPGTGSRSSWTIRVETSLDGAAFEAAAEELEPESLATFVERPAQAVFEARFPTRRARFLRLTNPGTWADRWSVAGIAVYSTEAGLEVTAKRAAADGSPGSPRTSSPGEALLPR